MSDVRERKGGVQGGEGERGGKRVAVGMGGEAGGEENEGQTGELRRAKKWQTKAHLAAAEPRGWKRIPRRVIVSHVLLPPPHIFQINAPSSHLHSQDKLQFHGEEGGGEKQQKTKQPQKGN